MFVALTLVPSSGSLNVMLTAVVGGTPVAPAAGVVAVTVGPVASRVVNAQVNGVAALPARSLAAFVIEAVMFAGFGMSPVGSNSAIRVAWLYVTVPGIAAPPVTRSVNDVVLIVVGFMFSLNVTVAVAERETPLKFVGGWFAIRWAESDRPSSRST